MKKSITVTVGGNDYRLVSSENDEYTRKVAAHVDSKIAAMMIQGNTRGMIAGLKDLHQYQQQDSQVSALCQRLLDCETANIRQMQAFL